jgi:hypothetical protein
MLFSAGLTVQLLVVIVALVLVPLVYIALGLALWIKPKSALLVTLGAHVVIGVLTLLQLPRAISTYYKLSETLILSYYSVHHPPSIYSNSQLITGLGEWLITLPPSSFTAVAHH